MNTKSVAILAAGAILCFALPGLGENQPNGVMSEPVSTARPVARWDVIPNQRVSGMFKAGVVAFHQNGVQVEFDVEGTKYTATQPTLNDRVNVWEYVCPIDVSQLPDGPFTVKATATSLSGNVTYDLPDLQLFANSNGSLDVESVVWVDAANGDDAATGANGDPLQTLQAASKKVTNGGTIYLARGVYGIQGMKSCTGQYWTTITHAPGLTRDDVELSPGRPGANHLRFLDVTFAMENESGYTPMISGENGTTVCWLDDCKGYNKLGRWSGNSKWFGNGMDGYVTGGETTDMTDGPDGSLIRDHIVNKISSDAWTGSDRLVVNCTARDVNPGSTGAHPDFFQSYATAGEWVHDVILYNVSGIDCASQGLFGVRLRDSAFVNISIHATTGMYTQWSDEMTNVMFWHVTLVDQTWLWREGTPNKNIDYTPTNVSVKNCMLRTMGSYIPIENFNGELSVDHCAFYGTDKNGNPTGAFGDDYIYVKRCFRDEATHDYTPTNELALAHGIELQCVPTDINGHPYGTGPRAVGAFAPSQVVPPQPPDEPGEPEVAGFTAMAWSVPKNLTAVMRTALSDDIVQNAPDFALLQGCSGNATYPWPEIAGWSFSVGRPDANTIFNSGANNTHAIYYSNAFTLLKVYPVVLQNGSRNYAGHRIAVEDSDGNKYGLMTFAGNPNMSNSAVKTWFGGLVGDITNDYPTATVLMNVCRHGTTTKYADLGAFLETLGFTKAAETDENGLFVLGYSGSVESETLTDSVLTSGNGVLYTFGGGSSSDPEPTCYAVTFDADGGSPTPDAQSVEAGAMATEPSPAPTKNGFSFDGWFNGAEAWNFASDTVTADVTLTAHWTADEPGPGPDPVSSGDQLNNLGASTTDRFVLPAAQTWPAEDYGAEVCLWRYDRYAACSPGHDDNCAWDLPFLLNIAEENHIKFTWWLITSEVEGSNISKGGTWVQWSDALSRGHAIESHSHTHEHGAALVTAVQNSGMTTEEYVAECLYDAAFNAISNNIAGARPTTIAYPGGEAFIDIASNCCVSARGTTAYINQAARVNYLNTAAPSAGINPAYLNVMLGGVGGTRMLGSLKTLNRDRVKYNRGWYVPFQHTEHTTAGVAQQAYVSAVESNRVTYALLGSYHRHIWLGTYPEIAKYSQSYATHALTVGTKTAAEIKFTLTDRMRDDWYDEPLTVKIHLPDGWTAGGVSATQGDATLDAFVVEHDNAKYALVNAYPDRGEVTVVPAAENSGTWDETSYDTPVYTYRARYFNDGAIIAETNIAINASALTAAPALIKDGFDLSWTTSDDVAIGNVTNDIDLVAVWTPVGTPQPANYTVTFDAVGGLPVPESQIVTDGGKVTEPTVPTKADCTFDGWFNGTSPWDFAFDTVSENITLVAHWSVIDPGPGPLPTSGTEMTLLGWVLQVKGYGQALDSSSYSGRLAALQNDFASRKPTVAFLTGTKGDVSFAIPGYGIAHTMVNGVPTRLSSVEGASEIIAWDEMKLALVRDYGVIREGTQAAGHAVVLRDGGGRLFAFVMIQGTNMNLTKSAYQTFVQSVLGPLTVDYPSVTSTFIAYSTLVGNTSTSNESGFAAYLVNNGFTEISRANNFVFFSKPAFTAITTVVSNASVSDDSSQSAVVGSLVTVGVGEQSSKATILLVY